MENTRAVLRERRLRRGLTIREISKIIGVTPQFYGHIETGRAPFPLKYANQIAKLLLLPKSILSEALILDYSEGIKKWL